MSDFTKGFLAAFMKMVEDVKRVQPEGDVKYELVVEREFGRGLCDFCGELCIVCVTVIRRKSDPSICISSSKCGRCVRIVQEAMDR